MRFTRGNGRPSPGGLLHHLFTLTRRSLAVSFLLHSLWRLAPPGVTRHRALRSPDFPRQCRGAPNYRRLRRSIALFFFLVLFFVFRVVVELFVVVAVFHILVDVVAVVVLYDVALFVVT